MQIDRQDIWDSAKFVGAIIIGMWIAGLILLVGLAPILLLLLWITGYFA
jgi:hypothetical protein